MSFRSFLAKRKSADPRISDLIADIKAEILFPAVGSWRDLETQLIKRGASPVQLVAALALWNQYLAFKMRLRFPKRRLHPRS